MTQVADSFVWPDVTKCTQCKSKEVLVKKSGKGYAHIATVWTGTAWKLVNHATKLCEECGARHKLNYVATLGEKKNTLRNGENNPIILLHGEFGFYYDYLRQLFHRVYRAGVSFLAEATTIILTYPKQEIGNSEAMTDNTLARLVAQGFFIFLRLREENYKFDVDDPVPDDDPEYGPPNKGLHVIFNAARDDPSFETKGEAHDVVTDGNWQCSRRLEADEKKYATRNLPGRPKKQKAKAKATAKAKAKAVAKPKPKSRRKAVTQVEELRIARTQTGGLFATTNMKNRDNGPNEVLHMGEMMNGECTPYGQACLEDMKKSKILVRKYAHDCACVVKDHFEGKLCKKVYLDGLHSKTHKCNTPAIIHNKALNSQACEQFWSRLDKQLGLQTMSRARYRCFLAHYCTWRNEYCVEGRLTSDTSPLLSAKKLKKRRRTKRKVGRRATKRPQIATRMIRINKKSLKRVMKKLKKPR